MNRRRQLLIAAVIVAGCALVVLPTMHVRFAYEGPVHQTSHVPEGKPIAMTVPTGAAIYSHSVGQTRKHFDCTFKVENATGEAKRYQVVAEYVDFRGTVVHRHVVGPLIVAPKTAVRFDDQLDIPKDEQRYIANFRSSSGPV